MKPVVMTRLVGISLSPATLTIDGHRHNHHHCHAGKFSVMVVMMVTITRIVVFAGMDLCPGERGPSWRQTHAGGDSAALRYRQSANRGLQGLRFAPGKGGS